MPPLKGRYNAGCDSRETAFRRLCSAIAESALLQAGTQVIFARLSLESVFELIRQHYDSQGVQQLLLLPGTDLDPFEVDTSGVEPIQIGKGQVTAPQVYLLPAVAGEGAAAEVGAHQGSAAEVGIAPVVFKQLALFQALAAQIGIGQVAA